jgi:hypothetical protein
MIAQKIADAKQPQQPVGALVTLPDSLATASRTFFTEHIRSTFLREKLAKSKVQGDVGIMTSGVF